MSKKEVDDILEKYKKKLDQQINPEFDEEAFSREYSKFKKELTGENISKYERFCNISEKILKIGANEKNRAELLESIQRVGLRITPEGAMSFATITGFFFIILAFLIVGVGFLFTRELNGGLVFFFMFFVSLGLIAMRLLAKWPNKEALLWRIKASDQMVLCVLYMVMYLRHTSNLEHAVKFAAQHLEDPLSSDLKIVFWNLETRRTNTITESLDIYLEGWRKYNMEFVNSIHLIESSLFEPTDKKRLEILDRALDVILNGTYERMLDYAHEIRNPITNLYMLGIILPILALIILPLMGAFIGIKWYWLAFLYNLVLPIFVYFRGIDILNKRPGGSSDSTILESEIYKQYGKIKLLGIRMDPILVGVPILLFVLIIGLSPLILHVIYPGSQFLNAESVFGFFDSNGLCTGKGCLGPYGIWAMYLSLLVPLAWTFGIGTYYKLKTKKLIEIKRGTTQLEKEFSGSLFQLGNRIGDGLPAELAVEKVADNMRGTPTGNFFRMIAVNIRKLGMGLEEAIFNRDRGAILDYPSNVIQSSMRVLVQSVTKGPEIAAGAMLSISEYLVNINKIKERLKDLLAEILSSMKGQINFLTPLIAGIVVGIGSMITGILVKLGPLLQLSGGEGAEGFGIDLTIVSQIFPVEKVIPPFFLQLVVGVYVLELAIILTKLSSGIEFGSDKIREQNEMGRNLFKGVGLYVIVVIVVAFILNLLTKGVLSGVGVGF